MAELGTCERCELFAAENARYRARVLELVFLADDAIAHRVEATHEASVDRQTLIDQLHRTETELDALRNTRLFRVAAPARAMWGWVRVRLGLQ